MSIENLPRTLEWDCPDAHASASLRLIDQRLLPSELSYVECTTADEVCAAIENMTVRGAPALGVAGVAAVALWVLNEWTDTAAPDATFDAAFARTVEQVAAARPTAVNLSWGAEQARVCVAERRAAGADWHNLRAALDALVRQTVGNDVITNRAIGKNGAEELARLAERVGRPLRIETHCNAGSLATVFYGTATSVIYAAYEQGLIEKVWVDETRPVDQGARLTAWELGRAGVPYTLICDDMTGSLMQQGLVDACIVGADRICANGDFANKIGTYGLAVLAHAHDVSFYCAAPRTTFDTSLADGSKIVIERRDSREVRCFPSKGKWVLIAPEGCDVYNPAFDVTPHALISGIITEEGISTPNA